MCRLIIARGHFDSRAIVEAAIAMSEGRTADHEGPTRCHPNGWGAVWSQVGTPHGLALHRDPGTLTRKGAQDSPVWGVKTEFLSMHVRHATLARNAGLEFTHPLERLGTSVPWYFMHNGFLPTVHRLLGRVESRFDSAEYFEYMVDANLDSLDTDATLEKLRTIPPGGTSANAIAVNPRRAYVLHYTPPNIYPRYFTMHRLERPDFLVFSSEIIPELGPAAQWERMPPEQIVEIPLS